MLYLRPQRVYKPSTYTLSDPNEFILDLTNATYRLRIETPRGTTITEDNSQITCYAHIFLKEDGSQLTERLKERGFRPTWLLDNKPIDSARVSEDGYKLTFETSHLPAILQTVTLQARDTDILLALTDDPMIRRLLQAAIDSGFRPSTLIETSEKLLDVYYRDKLINQLKQDLTESIKTNTDTLSELLKHPLTVSKDGYWRIWDALKKTYVTTEYQSRGEKGEPGDKGEKGDKPVITLDEQYRLLADGQLLSQQSLKGRDGEDGAKGDKGDTPNLSLDEQYRLVADGKLVSQQSLKGRDGEDGAKGADGKDGQDGHTPNIRWSGTHLLIDDLQAVDLRGQRGEAGYSPKPDEVLRTDSFRQQLTSEVTTQVKPITTDITNLQKVALTKQQQLDVASLTQSLQLLRSGNNNNNTLEGLALQRLIALSGNGKDISAYLASNALPAVLKAGITNFGTVNEREQVEITHQGTGHFGNLYFTGSQIDFRTSKDADPYLSMGAEENQFISEFLATARLDDTPVSVGTVTLSEQSKVYERTVSADHDGTRLTVVIDQLEVALYNSARTRLLLDGEELGSWQGSQHFTEGGGGAFNGVPDFRAEYVPYKGSNLSYERVVKAGSHTLRLEIAGKMGSGDSGATIKGLRIKRRYDTGRQQSAFAKNGLRLFGSPERYFDVDYREMRTNYLPNFGYIQSPNPYLVRIKGGAKVDRLTVDELDMPGVPLCGASFNENGYQKKAFGKYAKRNGYNTAYAEYDYSINAFKVYHSIGHTKYIPIVQVSGWNGGDVNWSLTPRVYEVKSDYFVVRILSNNDNPHNKPISYVAYKTM